MAPNGCGRSRAVDGYSSFAVFGSRAFTMSATDDKEIVICLDIEDKGQRALDSRVSLHVQERFRRGPALDAGAGPRTAAFAIRRGRSLRPRRILAAG